MKHRRSERGVALIICLFALLLLSGIGLGMMYMADTESSINRNYRDSQQAYFAAVAGVQEVRQRLMPTGSLITAGKAPTTLPGLGLTTGVTYVLNYTADIPLGDILPWNTGNTFFDTEFCKESFRNSGDTAFLVADPGQFKPCDVPPTGAPPTYTDSNSPYLGANNNLAYRWVRVTLKANNTAGVPYYVTSSAAPNNRPICWDGLHQLPKPNDYAKCDDDPPLREYLKSVYVLTSLAVIPNSGSRRMVQMEVANDPPFVTNAAVDSKDHVNLTGKLDVVGYDFCNCNCNKTFTSCLDRPGKTCDKTKWAIYSNQPVDTPGPSETVVAGPNPPIAECDPANGQTTGCTWPYDVPALINRFKTGAVNVSTDPGYNWTCSGTPANCGTRDSATFGVPPDFPPDPVDAPTKAGSPPISRQVTYIPGNVKLTSSATGNGVLIVDGDLEIDGGLRFYGLVLVKGVVKFKGGGKEATNIYGAVLAGEESIDDTAIGGSAVINFDRCALVDNSNPAPPKLLSTHELSY